jgi:hypothetical protein
MRGVPGIDQILKGDKRATIAVTTSRDTVTGIVSMVTKKMGVGRVHQKAKRP